MKSMLEAIDHPRTARGFGMHHALGLSVGVHALLVAVFMLLSWLWPAAAPVIPDEPVLKFSFKRSPEIAEPNQTPRGTVPDPTPPPRHQPAVVPSPEPPASAPSPAAPPPRPAQAQRPQPSTPAPEPQRRPDDAPTRPAEPTDERPGDAARERDDGRSRTGAVTPPGSVRERPTPDLDVRGALRDYQRAIDRAKASRPATSSAGSSKNVFVPDTSAMPVQGTPYGILEFSSRDYDWSDYYRQIYWDILKAWYRRMYATTADFEKWAHQNSEWILNHQSRISFVIHRSGNVSDIRLETPSGCVPLDASAMDGLSEVILVPLPDDFPRESEEVRATFIASGEIASMRQYFAYLKRINFF